MTDRQKIVLLGGKRTPIADFGKGLKRKKVDVLAQHGMLHAMLASGVQPEQVSGVVSGHGFQSPFTPNLARMAWLNAGWPDNVPAHTLQIQCGSGMKAVNTAMDSIWLGNGECYVAGGAESMSTVPYLVDGTLRFDAKRAENFKDFAAQYAPGMTPKMIDALSRHMANGWTTRQWNQFFANLSKYGPRPYLGVVEDGLLPTELLWDMRTTHMAQTAQNVANICKVSRAEMDAFSARSHERALAAIKSGRFAMEIAPISNGKEFLFNDEHPRESTIEKLAKLRGVNRTQDITAGNSSGINDAACYMVISTEDFAKKIGANPLANLLGHFVAGCDPTTMGLGPVVAIKGLLARHNLTLNDIDIIEINEAFAAQTLGCVKELGIDINKLNPNGGAIALGHPIAMSGARVILTLAHELKLQGKKRGIASLCIGGGMGIATLVENPDVA